MTHQIITKLSPRKFRSEWQGISNSKITMDFTPLIKQFNLEDKFALLHWQAKPYGYRRWGIYLSPDDQYIPFNWDDLIVQASITLETLQLDEQKWKTKPTAVIYIPNVTLQRYHPNLLLNRMN